MNYTVIAESPTRIQTEHPVPCENECDCETTILTSTIAGWMCSDCAKAFQEAACGLAKFRKGRAA